MTHKTILIEDQVNEEAFRSLEKFSNHDLHEFDALLCRYKNIYCYKHNAFPLEYGNGWIHASMVPERGTEVPKKGVLPQEECRAILAQGPKANTVEDFWEMVWRSGTDTIFMLTAFKEGRHEKCFPYYSGADDSEITFAPCSVKTLEKVEQNGIAVRKMEVKKKNESRVVTHIHAPEWGDHRDTSIELIYILLTYFPEESGPPPILHCSAGIGRSGTLLACWQVKQEIDRRRASGEGGKISITEIVKELRLWRPGAVQTYSQYLLIHKYAEKYLAETETQSP